MAVSLNTNISALSTQRRLSETTAKLNKSFERLSSGLRINTAGDDAAGLAISESLRTDSRVFSQGLRNLNDGVSITNIAESTLNEMTNIITRIQELAQQAANGTLSNTQRKSIDAEAQALSKEYFRVSRVAEFNGLRLFDGSTQSLTLQAGYGTDGSVISSLGGKLGTGTVSGATTNLLVLGDPSATSPLASTLGDLNLDGYLDLVSAGMNSAYQGYASVQLGSADGTFGAAVSYATEVNRSEDVHLADLNGDGVLDLLTAGWAPTDGRTTIRLGRGDGTFGAATSYSSNGYLSRDVDTGDLNNDGILDLVTAGLSNGPMDGYVTIRMGRGDGTFGASVSIAGETRSSLGLALGDLNNDGILDIVSCGDTDGSDAYVTVNLGRGDGTFRTGMSYATNGTNGRRTDRITLGDVNQDGFLDIVGAGLNDVAAGDDGMISIMLNRGDGSYSASMTLAGESASSTGISLADLNGDGSLDLISGGNSSASEGFITLRLGRGDGQFTAPTSIQMFTTGEGTERVLSVMSGDLNRDGVVDVVAAGFGTYGGTAKGVTQVLFGDTREGCSPLSPISLRTKADALQAIPVLKQTLQRVSSQRGTIGALQSRLGIAASNLQVARENYDSARSQITDVDVAGESAQLLKTQIAQQAASSILAQANFAPRLALNLLRG